MAFATLAGCLTNATSDADRSNRDDKALVCLRNKPLRSMSTPGDGLMSALASTSHAGYFAPCVDGIELTTTPEVYAARGEIVPSVKAVMVGTVLNEGRYLMPVTAPVPNAPLSTHDDVRSWLEQFYPTLNSQRVFEVYAADAKNLKGWELASLMYTDSQYLCPTQRSANWLTQRGGRLANTYVYRLEYQPTVYKVKRNTCSEQHMVA